jgi:hypothetical protein
MKLEAGFAREAREEMLRKFMLWLVGVIVLLAVWIVLKGNVGWLIWAMLAWWVAGAAWQVIRARKSHSAVASTRNSLEPLEDGNQFDPDFCGRVLRIAAVCFAAMILLQFIFFFAVKSVKCPGWQAATEKESGSVWGLWVFATLWTLNIGYHALTWRRHSQKIRDQIEWARQTYVPGTNPTWFTDPTQFRAMCTAKNDVNTIMIMVLVGSGLFVALPALTRIGCF